MAGLALATSAGFLIRESTASAPMLDLRLLRNRRLVAAALGGLLASFGVAGALFVLTQYFQFLLRLDPLAAGLRMIPLAVALLVGSSVLSAQLLTRAGAAAGIGISMTTGAVRLIVIALSPTAEALPVTAGLILLGLGVGMAGPIAGTALMASLPLDQAGIGGGFNSTMQEMGNALGVAVLGSVLTGVFLADAGLAAGSSATTFPEVLAESSTGALQINQAFAQGLSVAYVFGAVALLAGGIGGYALLRAADRAGTPVAKV